MGAEEQSSPAKHSKPTSTHETTPPPYPDWSQACYSSGFAPPFFASSPAPPYMWGGQTPGQTNLELEVKASNGKDRAPNKKPKGNSGNSNAGGGRAASSSGNDGATQSAESGNDVSSDGTDEDDQQEYSGSKKGSFHQMLADANARNNNSGSNIQTPVPGNPVASMPPTDLNMGIDLWNPSTGTGSMKLQKNHSGVHQTPAPPPMMSDHWVQDERELKRQKRKQSNRESARRSRLRKQAECEELQARVEALSNENHSLRDELRRLSEECGNLTSENNSIKDELTRFLGPEAVSKLDTQLQSQTRKGDS